MRYNGRFILAIIGALFIFAVIIGHAQNPAVRREPLSAAMRAVGADVEEMSINGWAKLANDKQSDAKLEEMARTAMQSLGISDDSYTIIHNQTQYQHMARAEAVADYFHAVAVAEVIYPRGDKNKPEVYLVVNIEAKPQQDSDMQEWKNKIIGIMENFGGEARISTCLVGWLDGKLGDEEWNKHLGYGFNAVNATIIDKVRTNNFVSLTGFSPAIEEYLTVGDRRINVNMAMRYSPYDDRTYVTIGSPVITREY